MKRLWVSGWAIPEKWFAQTLYTLLPQDQHEVILPIPGWFERLQIMALEADMIAGYSFGSFLLLQKDQELAALNKPIELYAPFLDFKAEAGKGSNITLTQLKFLKRWLSRKPLDAINDFYQKAELEIGPCIELPYLLSELDWGLDQMISTSVSDVISNKYNAVIIGNLDKLINIDILSKMFKDKLLLDCNHSLTQLLRGRNNG